MKNISLVLILYLFCLNSFSQKKLDTIYILFDSTKIGMKKESYKAFKSSKYPKENIKTSYSYRIDEKKHENPYLYDTGYTFTHFNQSKSEYETFGGTPPMVVIKNYCFLRKIKPLNINFFLTTSYKDVCETFETEDGWEQDVVIFMIDKDEIKDGKVILREVTFSRPVKE